MRKMIWCGTALLVFGAGAVFFAARYAAENPESLLGRCARAAYYVGVRCTPLAYLNQPAAQEHAFAGRPVRGAGLPIPAPEMPADEQQEAPLAERPEVVESIVVEEVDEREAAVPAPAGQTAEPARLPEEPDGFTPPADDSDLPRLPTTMPYADDDEVEVQESGTQADAACMTEFLKMLVQNHGTKPCPSCSRGLVQSVVDCVKEMLGQDTDSAEQVEVPAEPVQVSPAPGGAGGEEAQENGKGPNSGSGFREDPYYHHQYPSCPYTGQCPYPHNYNLPPVTEPMKKSKPDEQSRLILDEDRIMQWTQAATTDAGVKALMANIDSVLHGDIDTMECRPTDVPDLDNDETF